MLKLSTEQILASLATLTPEELEEVQQQLPQGTNFTDTPVQNSHLSVDNYNIAFGSRYGSYVTLNTSELPLLKARPTPPSLLPRRLSPDWVGREQEIDTIIKTLKSHKLLEIYGPPGIGKTTLLSHLADREDITRQPSSFFPDGVVSFSGHTKPVEDLLQELFDAFYESDSLLKLTNTQIRSYLLEKKALIILDDVKLEIAELEELLDNAPNCSFLVFSSEQRLAGKAESQPLAGLTKDQAETLIKKNLGKASLEAEDKAATEHLYEVFQGYPLPLLQISALAKQEGISLQDALNKVLDNSHSTKKSSNNQDSQSHKQPVALQDSPTLDKSVQKNGSQTAEQSPDTKDSHSPDIADSETTNQFQERLEQVEQASEVTKAGVSAVKEILEGNFEGAVEALGEAGDSLGDCLAGRMLKLTGALLKTCTSLESEIVSVLSALNGQGLLPEQIAALIDDQESDGNDS